MVGGFEMGIGNEHFGFMYNTLWFLFYLTVISVISISVLFKHFEDKEWKESVEVYNLPLNLRPVVGHLKYPGSNDGIWEYNDKNSS